MTPTTINELDNYVCVMEGNVVACAQGKQERCVEDVLGPSVTVCGQSDRKLVIQGAQMRSGMSRSVCFLLR